MKKIITASLMALSGLAVPVAALAQSADDFNWDYTYSYTPLTDAEATAAAGALGVMAVVPFVIVCVVLVVNLVVAILIYKNAKKLGVENPVLWFVLSLLLGWIGWLLYFLVGKKKVATSTGPVSA